MDSESGNSSQDTLKSVEKVSTSYTRGAPQDQVIRELVVRTFLPYLNPEMRGLQLGYAEGVDTEMLVQHLASMDVVEGSSEFIALGKQRSQPNVVFHHALFETFLPKQVNAGYDAVFAIYVLEHVVSPVSLLQLAYRTLAPGGRIFIVVLNAHALSRQLALHMGLLPSLTSLTDHDKDHGHRRVYERVSLNRDLEAASLRIIAQGGIMLKILADFQLNALIRDGMLGPAQIDGLYRLGHVYPDLCGSLYAICDKP